MVVVPMRVKRWNWNEVKSEELAGLSVALVGPPPWDPERASSSMPGDAIVTEPAGTDIHLLLYCLPSHHAQGIQYTRRRNGHANPKTTVLRTRKAQPVNLRMRACTPPICNIGNALYRWRFPRLD